MGNDGRQIGKDFESLFLLRAQQNGLLAEKNHLSAQHTYGGRTRLLKSNLDFTLISQKGRVGYYDCKSFEGAFFVHSQIDPHQLKLCLKYEFWNVPSGFVVFLRESGHVFLFKGSVIEQKGPGERLSPEDGICLGRWDSFDLKPLLAPKPLLKK
jgi:hypothetical protein